MSPTDPPKNPIPAPIPEESTEKIRPVVGEAVELTLDRLGHGGEAVGRADGFVHFVRYGAPGDRVRATPLEVKKSFARSRLDEVIEPSPERVDPTCEYYGECGGCHLQHLSDAGQLAARVQDLRDALQRIAGITEPVVEPCVSLDRRWGYRHRVVLHAVTSGEDVGIGYVDVDGTGLVPIDSCPIALEGFAPVIRALDEASLEARGIDGHIDIRTGYPSHDVHVHLREGTEGLVSPLLRRLQAAGVEDRVTIFWNEENSWRSAPRAKPAPLTMVTPWATWRVPPNAFYQVNPELAIRVAETVREWISIEPEGCALDLYAGMGFFAAAIADKVDRLWAVERHRGSIRAGERAFKAAKIENVRFVPGAVESTLPTMTIKGRLDAVVLDPPREGIQPTVADAVTALAPNQILYISCEPTTLARDIKRMIEAGYRHVKTRPFDFFPQTYHVESLTLLERSVAR
jgi:23S rRNA (uracil1939-C5)-methyltransferase